MDIQDELPAGDDLQAALEGNPSSASDESTELESGANAETSAEDGEETSQESGDETGEGEGEPEEGADQPKPKKASGSERLKRRVERLEAELVEARTRRPAPAGDASGLAAAIEAEIGAPPKEEDFKNFLDYERAATAYELDKRQATRELNRRAADDTTKAKQRFADLVDDHADRLDVLETRVPGAMAKIEKAAQAGLLKVTAHVNELVLDSEKSGLLNLHFAENPEKLAELNRMTPVQAAREIGRLESRLSLPKPKTATKAPAPVSLPKGSAAPGPDPSKMTMAQYEAWRSKGGGR